MAKDKGACVDVLVKQSTLAMGTGEFVRVRVVVDGVFKGQLFFAPEEWDEVRKTLFVEQRLSSPTESAPNGPGVHWREESN